MTTYLFPPIAEGDLINEAAHEFMSHLQFIREERVDELRSDRNGMKEEVEQWLDFELRRGVENAREDPHGGESHFMFDGVGVADIEKIVDIIFVTLGDRPSSDLGFYNYSDDERLDDEANILLTIEDSISQGNTKLIKPHAIFGSLPAFGRKCDDIIDSSCGLAEHLGHIEKRSYTEDQVFRPLWLKVGLVTAFPSHFHSGVVAKVIENGARELALVARYDHRITKHEDKGCVSTQISMLTDTEERRVRALLKAFYARVAMQHLHEAWMGAYADYEANKKTFSAEGVVK